MSKTCSDCVFLWYHSPDMTQPYPEFACTKGHWEDLSPDPDYQTILSEETDCNDFKKDESRTAHEPQTEYKIPSGCNDLPF